MKLIIGLGNPGEKYEKTRHNLGFRVLDLISQNSKFNPSASLRARVQSESAKFRIEKKFKAEILETECNGEKIILVKPLTYMNNSGMAVQLISSFYKIESDNIWVIHDDIDLLLGSMKIRFGGASAGHKGVDSIISSLGTDRFWRFRIGIAGKKSELGQKMLSGERMKRKNIDDIVLGEFAKEEQNRVKEEVERASKAVLEALEVDMEYVQQKFNKR